MGGALTVLYGTCSTSNIAFQLELHAVLRTVSRNFKVRITTLLIESILYDYFSM